MVPVRGVNVFPSAIAEILASFPELSGEFQVELTFPPPYNRLPLRVELASGVSPAGSAALADTLVRTLQERLNFRAGIELVPAGTLPRTQGKTGRVLRTYE
jgi:phenylacetate-CoA ligase